MTLWLAGVTILHVADTCRRVASLRLNCQVSSRIADPAAAQGEALADAAKPLGKKLPLVLAAVIAITANRGLLLLPHQVTSSCA